MQARTLLYKAMVASPLGFIAWMGIVGRFSADTFEFTSCTAAQQSVLSDYIEPVRLMSSLGNRRPRRFSTPVLLKMASNWQETLASRELKPIRPPEFGTCIRDGVCAEILSAFRKAGEVDMALGDRMVEAKNYDEAANHYLMAAQTVKGPKYSDSVAVAMFGAVERDSLRAISSIVSKLSSKRKTLLIAELTSQLSSLQSLEPIARHEYAIYTAYLRTREKPMETDTVPGTIVALADSHPREEDQLQTNRDYTLALRSEDILTKQLHDLRARTKALVVLDLKK